MELIGPLQLRIMQFLWESGPSTIHTVVDRLNSEPGSKRVRYTTAATVMKNLAKRNVCTSRQVEGRQFEYTPLITSDAYTKQVLTYVRDTLCGGNVHQMRSFVKDL